MFTMLISLSTYIGEAIEALCAWPRLVAGSLCPVVAGTRSSGLTHRHYSAQEAGGRGSLNMVDLSPSTYHSSLPCNFSRDTIMLTTVDAHHQEEVLRIPNHPQLTCKVSMILCQVMTIYRKQKFPKIILILKLMRCSPLLLRHVSAKY